MAPHAQGLKARKPAATTSIHHRLDVIGLPPVALNTAARALAAIALLEFAPDDLNVTLRN
jgi:hypothetical protein